MRWMVLGAALGLAGCVACTLPPEQQQVLACQRRGLAYEWHTRRCVPGPAGALVDAAPASASGPDLNLPAWSGQVVEPGSPEAAALDALVTGKRVDLPWATAGSGLP